MIDILLRWHIKQMNGGALVSPPKCPYLAVIALEVGSKKQKVIKTKTSPCGLKTDPKIKTI
jgi:hypothetical protein